MGVPKFYRWVSERYPCLSQVVQEHQIPEFDNMYLDMNGIIHPCSHPNDDDPHFRITEEQIFANIFHYIEVLFQIIKPKKVFFMAVDGVAPRAKMNQQRGRRFRSAREAEDNIRKALSKGQVLPKEERFDSNCITPGTVFMVRLQEQLQYFVNDKISNDPAWQGLRIYLSGQQCPGEGEHKIMEFIRTEKTRPDYDPNTRHCLYGLDADLMMLGLTSHEPHFSLLREEVRFGKTSKRIEKPEQITFHLLHLSLFREYLDWEFNALKTTLPFEYDLERIIDDWILVGFLVGNDFIPHLPYMHINHDALPMFYRKYIQIMPSMDGYLHDGGILNLTRFEKYLAEVSKYDREKFDETFVDMKWFEAKAKHKFGEKPKTPKGAQLKPKVSGSGGVSTQNKFSGLDSLAAEFEQFKLGSDDGSDTISPELAELAARMDDEDGDEEVDEYEIEFEMHKKNYYSDKFEIEHVHSDIVSKIAWEYIRGIQWILHYYFNGVQSWSWYYPYHYAPFLSDVKDFSHYQLTYEMSKAFLPFEQLLAVLPAASKQLLPATLQNLMIMEQSPIIDYYPLNFKTDLNGKQQEWEAVVLIPFIDEKRLLEAMRPLYRLLTKEEANRNCHGPFHLYTYDKTLSDPYPSSLPGKFPDIAQCHARCEKFERDEIVTPPERLKKGLLQGVKLEVYFPGFPTLYHIPHTAELRKASIKVFQMHSRSNSMILQLKPQPQVTIQVAEQLLGETCYVGWPHMVEALVVAVSDNTFRYSHKRGTKEIQQDVLTEEDGWEKQAKSFTQGQMERRGIEVGPIDILIDACPVVGRRFLCSAKGQVTLEKEWSPLSKQYALQTIAKDIHVHKSVSEDSVRTIEELFPVDSPCFMLAMPHYGSCGKVLEVDIKQGRIRVQLRVPEEPDIASIAKQRGVLSVGYLPSHVVAQKMGISPGLLGKITSKFLIEQGSREKSKGQGSRKIDIGLNLKLTKQNKELLGYTRRTEQGWLFSQAARNVISQYLTKFPQLFDALAAIQQNEQYYEGDLTSQGLDASVLTDVQNWLKSLPLSKQTVVTCGSDILDDPILEAIEEEVKKVKNSHSTKSVKVRVRPYLLFRPSDFLGNILPDSDTEFQLFDRVVNVKLNSAIPFGLRGTVVGFHIGEDDEEMVEVLFDEHFIGAQSIRRTTNGVYLAHPSSLINLTFGERQEMRKRGIAATPPRPLTQPFASALANGNSRSPRKNGSPRVQGRPVQDNTPENKLHSPVPGVIRIMSGNAITNGPTPDRHGSPSTLRQSTTPNTTGRTPSKTGHTPNASERTPNATGRTPNSSERTPVTRQTPDAAGRTPNTTKGTPNATRQTPDPVGRTPNTAEINSGRASNTPGQPPSDARRTTPQRKETGRPRKHEVPPRFAKNTDNSSEFASMWKELQSKETSPPDTGNPSAQHASSNNQQAPNAQTQEDHNVDDVMQNLSGKLADEDNTGNPIPTAKESTQALCDLLQIGHKSPSDNSEAATSDDQPADTIPKQDGSIRALSLDQLFSSQKPSPVSAVPAQESISPAQALLNWCAAVGLQPPTFYYTKTDKGFVATVELANGFKFSGTQCKDRSEASHSAAAVALSQMRRMMPPQFPASPQHPQLHPLMGPYPQHVRPIPLMRGMPQPMFGFPMHQMSPHGMSHQHGMPLHMVASPRHDMHQRSAAPRQHYEPRGGQGVEHARKTPRKSLDPASNPFIPLQVTRRNVTPKSAPSTPQHNTEDTVTTRQELESTALNSASSPQKTITEFLKEASNKNDLAESQSVSTLKTASKETSELNEAKGLEIVNKPSKSVDGKSSASATPSDKDSPRGRGRGAASTPPSQGKSARRPESAGRSKPLMAPSFFQTKKS